jgi:hypothetical protein
LSEVLETHVASKYYLSPRACAGILRRAEKRGKELPLVLKSALEAVAEKSPPQSALEQKEEEDSEPTSI